MLKYLGTFYTPGGVEKEKKDILQRMSRRAQGKFLYVGDLLRIFDFRTDSVESGKWFILESSKYGFPPVFVITPGGSTTSSNWWRLVEENRLPKEVKKRDFPHPDAGYAFDLAWHCGVKLRYFPGYSSECGESSDHMRKMSMQVSPRVVITVEGRKKELETWNIDQIIEAVWSCAKEKGDKELEERILSEQAARELLAEQTKTTGIRRLFNFFIRNGLTHG